MAEIAVKPVMTLRRIAGLVFDGHLVLVVLLLLVPTAALVLDDPFLVRVAFRVVVFSITAVALNLVLGYGGLVSLMHASFFGIGGYVIGILSSHDFDGEPFLGFIPGTSELLISVPMAVVVGAITAAITGAVSLRTSGVYFIMITLAFCQMLFYFFVALGPYGGEDGLQIFSTLTAAGLSVSRIPLYYFSVIALAVVVFLVKRVLDSRFGVIFQASAQNERRLVALGLNPFPYKLTAFILSGGIAAFAGALLAISQQYVSPADMSWARSGDLIVMCVLGGIALVWGPILGAAAFVILELVLSSYTIYWQLGFGLIVVTVALFTRGGLGGLLTALRPRNSQRG